jgi:8-oxo-dGTP diphosphatase|tara:strand:- start:292 stop:633 length:342 start_codon:yes stop_codon:yes gene_type:complete
LEDEKKEKFSKANGNSQGVIEDETPEECLIREIKEEFGVVIEVGEYVGESIFDYGEVEIRLLGYYATHVSGEFIPKDHDRIELVFPKEFGRYDFAEADIPLTQKVVSNYSLRN